MFTSKCAEAVNAVISFSGIAFKWFLQPSCSQCYNQFSVLFIHAVPTCVALPWNAAGTDTGLKSACTPKAKCNYMLSQATIKKEAAVNSHSSQMVMQLTVFAGQGVRGKTRKTEKDEGEAKFIMWEIVEQHLSALAVYHTALHLSHVCQWESSHAPVSINVCAHPVEVWEIPGVASSGRNTVCGVLHV